MITWAILAVIGLATGFLAGLFGLGGGMLLVPALSFLLPALALCSDTHAVSIAIATSLASVLITSLSAAWAHHQKRRIAWQQVKLLAPGLILGAIIGATLTSQLNGFWLALMFGTLEIMIALKIWFNPHPHPHPPGKYNTPLSWMYGAFSGLISSLLGIGGGTINSPWLLRQGLTLHHAIATSSILGIIIAFFGTITHLNNELIQWPILLIIASTSLMSAYWGARTAHHLSVTRLSKFFALLIFLLGLSMLYQAALSLSSSY